MNRIIFLTLLSLFVSCSGSSKSEDHHHEGEEHVSAAGVKISSEQIDNFKISFNTIATAPFREVIKTVGVIESSGSDIYTVIAKKSGVVKLAEGITQGASIDQGKLIATISSAGLEGGDVSQAAVANLNVAKAEYERLKPLYEDRLITASQFREAERAYEEAKALAGSKPAVGFSSESSPVKGVITNLLVNSGEYVEKGSPIAIISKNAQMTLKAELPMRLSSSVAEIESANFIPEGSNETVKLDELQGKKISGASVANDDNGYIPVYFSFSGNPAYRGFAEVFLLGKQRNGVISVPRSALLEMQGNKYVYAKNNHGNYEKRLVYTGEEDGELVEIKNGLKTGDEIVSNGASVVRMLELSSVAPPAHTHNH